MVKGLAEVRWLAVASPYPIMVYTDHQALRTLLTGPTNDSHGRIANWQQRLSEYDMILIHRHANTHFMGIADGMSRLPNHLMSPCFVEDAIGTDAEPVGSNGYWGGLLESGDTGGLEGAGRETVGVAMVRAQEGGMDTREGNSEILEEEAHALQWERWKRWIRSDFFRRIVLFKLGGVSALTRPEEDVGRNEIRRIVRLAEKFVLADSGGGGENSGRLFYRERDGSLAGCVVEEEVPLVLRNAHDAHGHFAQGITSGRLFGHHYWPTRNHDVARWIATCDSCQRVSPLRKSGNIRPILQLQPMDMWGMDYIGPITPTCVVTGLKYILMIVDYFSRFLFARPLEDATMHSTMEVILNHVTPITGWPRSVYSDNGSHFTGKDIKDMFERFGVTHFSAAISHPSAVGLAERYVQMLTGRIRLKCIDRKSSSYWGLLVREAVMDINTRCIWIHGYTPAEILLGYNPVRTYLKIPGEDAQSWLKDGVTADDVLHPTEGEINAYIDKRDEIGASSTERLAEAHRRTEKTVKPPGGSYKKPEPGDLVLLRDLQRDKHLGRKLDPRWTEPRIVERLAKNGMSAYIRALHEGPDKSKRYHIDDLRVYRSWTITRDQAIDTENVQATAITYSRDAFGDGEGNFRSWQRAFNFTDIG